MRLLLSAHDLIAIFEHSDPVSPEQLDARLRSCDGCLVLTGTNVVEASVCMLEAGKSMELRSMLRAMASLPLSYLKELAIFVEELGGGLVAFGRAKEPLTADPYVAQWSDTLGVSLGKSYSSQGIFETVAHLWRTAPEALRHFHRYQEILAEHISSEPSTPEGEDASPEFLSKRFSRYIERQLRLHGFTLPPSGPGAFASWVYSNPLYCPGLRLAFELNQEILKQAEKTSPDPPHRGLGHLHAIPYADGITIEQPLFGYCQSVSTALQRTNPAVAYGGRTHPNLRSLLQHWP